MRTKTYTITKSEKGYALVPEKVNKNHKILLFKDKMSGIEHLMELTSTSKITLEAALPLAEEIEKIEDIDPIMSEAKIASSLAEKIIRMKINELREEIIIKNHKDSIIILPCRNCGKHGKIVHKDFWINIESKFDGYKKAEDLLQNKKITQKEKDELDLLVTKSGLQLENFDILSMLFDNDLTFDKILSMFEELEFFGKNPLGFPFNFGNKKPPKAEA